MPTFLISIFQQVMFCAVIWILEKQSKKKSWGHMCLSKKTMQSRVMWPKAVPEKLETLPQGRGGVKIQKTLCSTGTSPSVQEVLSSFHTWEDSASWGDRQVTKQAHGESSRQVVPGPPKKHPPRWLWFLSLQLAVSEPLPGIVMCCQD